MKKFILLISKLTAAKCKHDYKPVIVNSAFGWAWAQRCNLCGKVAQRDFLDALSSEEFRVEIAGDLIDNTYRCMTAKEVKKLYPSYDLYERDIANNPLEYRKIEVPHGHTH